MDGSTHAGLTLQDSKIGGQVYLGEWEVGGAVKVSGSNLTEGLDLSNTRVGGELALLGSKFGGPVVIGDATLAGAPRIVGCTPTDPLEVGDTADESE
jgi:hypothetical protein